MSQMPPLTQEPQFQQNIRILQRRDKRAWRRDNKEHRGREITKFSKTYPKYKTGEHREFTNPKEGYGNII